MLISELSLSQTVDGINATYFEGRALAAVGTPAGGTVDRGAAGAARVLRGDLRRIPLRTLDGNCSVHWRACRVGVRASHPRRGGLTRAAVARVCGIPGVTRALEAADDGLMQCLVRGE